MARGGGRRPGPLQQPLPAPPPAGPQLPFWLRLLPPGQGPDHPTGLLPEVSHPAYLPLVSFFTQIATLVANKFFENGDLPLEIFCHDVDRWPSPNPGNPAR